MKTILIVDDNSDVCSVTAEILEMQGYKTTQVHDGEKAVSFLKDNDAPDLIITDILMPNMDGYSFLEHLKLNGSNVPVLAISGGGITANIKDVSDAIEGLADRFVGKPLYPEKLVEIVRDMIG